MQWQELTDDATARAWNKERPVRCMHPPHPRCIIGGARSVCAVLPNTRAAQSCTPVAEPHTTHSKTMRQLAESSSQFSADK
jgi:hypothetical protein